MDILVFADHLFFGFSWYNLGTLSKDNWEHIVHRGKNDTLFKDRESKNLYPYLAAHTYIAHIWKCPPLPPRALWVPL